MLCQCLFQYPIQFILSKTNINFLSKFITIFNKKKLFSVPQEPDQDRKPSQSEDPQPSQSQKQFYSQSGRPRHHAPAYRYGQRTSESRNVVTYLQPVASQETPYSGIRGPSSGAIKK